MLRLLLAFQILYTVYQDHYVFETGIPGINVPNALFLLALAFIVMSRSRDAVTEPAALRTPIILFSISLIAGFAVAQARAPGDFMTDLTYLKNALFSPLLYFMYLRCRQDPRNTRLLIVLVMAVAAVAAVQAIRQGFDYGFGDYVESHRASGPFGSNYRSANRAGVYYAMFLPMFLAMTLFFRKERFWRIAALAGSLLLAVALMFTYSRQSYFIALAGLAVLLLRRSLVAAVLVGTALVLLAGYLPDSVSQRVAETQQSGPHGEETVDASTASRWEIWSGAMAMWQDNPAGVGLNRFKNEIGRYSAFKGYDAHNFYVLTFAECGPFGLAALLWLIYAVVRLGSRLRRAAPPDDPERRALAMGFSVAALCMALGNLYGSPFLQGNVMGTFWILAGLLERYAAMAVPRDEPAVVSAAKPVDAMVERFPLAARTNRIGNGGR